MSELLVRPRETTPEAPEVVVVTPESAGWSHVGFEALDLAPGAVATRSRAGRELCVVVLSGHVHVSCELGAWADVGGRASPFDGPPDAVHLPPGGEVVVEGAGDGAEVGLCWAPAQDGVPPRRIRAADVAREERGYGAQQRIVHNVLMLEEAAESLLVTEVVTPSGCWSSYPPHKHDRDALPEECALEETYYHRVTPPDGFALQRVYTDERDLDEAMAVHDRDLVLVPRGYHLVATPPGVASYYLNVMAGPHRTWAFRDDPALAWTRPDGATADVRIPKDHP